jgi:hypothetical protein
VGDDALPEVLRRFDARGIACAAIGRTDSSRLVRLQRNGVRVPFWDLKREALIGCGPNHSGAAHVQ